MNEHKLVVEITNIAVPLVCAGCGETHKDAQVKAVGLQTSYLGGSRQIIAYCHSCSFEMAVMLMRLWQ